MPEYVPGPTFAEMRDPSLLPTALREKVRAARAKPLDPLNLFNLSWKADGAYKYVLLPKALTGVDAPILVMQGCHFPTGAHKVGPAYSCLVEKEALGQVEPGVHTAVWPSTGNYGIGGAWVGRRMGYRSVVVLPEEMSQERFEKIRGFGAEVIATPGCESNVKEIFDKVHELRRNPENRIIEQFSEFGNYRFHYEVTGNSIAELAKELGWSKVAAFVSAMGSAGTIAAGDRLKQLHGTRIIGLEPVQCPTLYNVGFGGHRIEGIGDKHVTWIHNVLNMDALICIDDLECLLGLQLFQEGTDVLLREGVENASALVGMFGVSGVCNVLGAIKTAKYYGLSAREPVVTMATDGFDRYPSVLRKLDAEHGKMTADEAKRRLETVFRSARTDYVLEGTRDVRHRWHNQKYFTWVEQQGKTVEELRQQESQDFWLGEQAKVAELDKAIVARRGAAFSALAS
ncbi:MAG TPA: pyridoxal-phosphate dependent enzyme [Myxococcaceae bacterium]|nr:pyridoxal-phosphate dependent enzyme [Myxococcaceae bacterium]